MAGAAFCIYTARSERRGVRLLHSEKRRLSRAVFHGVQIRPVRNRGSSDDALREELLRGRRELVGSVRLRRHRAKTPARRTRIYARSSLVACFRSPDGAEARVHGGREEEDRGVPEMVV